MKSEIRNYYQKHFGEFEALSLKDIQEFCDYELTLIRLPELFYNRIKSPSLLPQQDYSPANAREELKRVIRFFRN